MKHKIISLALASAMLFAFTGCTPAETSEETTEAAPATASSETTEEETTEEPSEETTEETTEETAEEVIEDDVIIRVGSLHGPTTIGILNLIAASENGSAPANYEFTEMTQPDELAAALNAGDVDIAMIPANMASILYNRTGSISVIDINTLGVIDCISGDETVNSVSDLAGRTVYSIGQGATPEYALNYLLQQYEVTDCTIEFKAEAAEVIAELANDPDAIAILPEPAASSQAFSNDDLSIRFTLTDAWNEVVSDSELITGVTVVRNDFLQEHPAAVDAFSRGHMDSISSMEADMLNTAYLACDRGFFNNADMALLVIPNCNAVCITGDDMKTALEGYLNTLLDQNPDSIGGALPGEDFYYLG